MWRRVASFNGAVYVLTVEVSEWLNLDLTCFEYDADENEFVMCKQKHQTFRPSRKLCELSCFLLGFEVLLDRNSGVYLPFFIAQLHDFCYLFCFDSCQSPQSQWAAKYYFKVPKLHGENINFAMDSVDSRIANGPAVIWTSGAEVFVYKAEYSHANNTECILKLSVDSTSSSSSSAHVGTQGGMMSGRILWWYSGQYHSNYEHGLIVFGNLLEQWTYHVSLSNTSRSGQIELTSSYIPTVYLQVMTCCYMFYPSQDVNSRGEHTPSVFISTCQRQLLEFVGGRYVKHLNIPLSGCQVIDTFECHDGKLILLCSQDGQICAVDWTSHQILTTYCTFHNVLVDDFIGKGAGQVLLIAGGSRENVNIFEDFLLLDFMEVNITKRQEKEEVTTKEADNTSMADVFVALDQKVKAAETSIMDYKIEKSEKLLFAKKHCGVLRSILMKRKTVISVQQSHLASLTVGQKIISAKDEGQKSSKLAVLSKWQHLYPSIWIVAVEIENIGESAVCEISLSLVSKNAGLLSSHSKTHEVATFQLSHDDTDHGRTAHAPVLPPGHKLIVTCTSGVPNLTCQRCFIGGLVLSWKQKESGGYFAQFCGEVNFTVDHIMSEKQEKETNPRVCHHLAVSLMETQVLLSSSSNNNKLLAELLKSKLYVCQFCRSIISLETKYRLRVPHLAAVHIILRNVPNGVVLRILTRDHGQLYLILWSLKQLLPDDVSWGLPHNYKLTDSAISWINEEVISQIRSLEAFIKTNLDSLGKDTVLINNKEEEMLEKRRKLSKVKDLVQSWCEERGADLHTCLEQLFDICQKICITEKIWKNVVTLH